MNINYILGVNLTFDYYSLAYVHSFVLLLVRCIQRMLVDGRLEGRTSRR